MLNNQTRDSFIIYLQVNGYSLQTIRAYTQDLDWFMSKIGPEPTTWQDLEVACANALRNGFDNFSPRTVQRRLSSVRSWAKHYNQQGFLSKFRPPSVVTEDPHPLKGGIEDVKKMLASTRNPRHKALLALTGLLGARVSEACNVRPSDINLVTRSVTFRRGKGNKTRTVPFGDFAWTHLSKAYYEALPTNRTLVDRSESGARSAVHRHGRNAGLEEDVHSHQLRATAATAMYEATHDLAAVQDILGHATPVTTRRYTMISDTAKRAAIEALS